MKTRSVKFIMLALILSMVYACKENPDTGEVTSQDTASSNTETGEDHNEEEEGEEGHSEEEGGMRSVHLSELKFNSLGIKVDTLPKSAFGNCGG